MILQALAHHYETMLELGQIASPGWGESKVTFGLELGENGQLVALVPYKQEQQRGKKAVLAPRILSVPMPVKRSVNVAANFLCDTSGYLLGADGKGKANRTADCFAASRALHEKILAGVNSPAARAVLAFYAAWQPAAAAENPLLSAAWSEICAGANLVFCFGMQPVCEDSAIRAAWQAFYDTAEDPDAPVMQCLVTGQTGPVAAVHPAIKGVRNAQSSGAALVSFNGPAFESYGRSQGYNAPISRYAAFAYTTAINALLSDTEHCKVIGDTTVVCWAEHGSPSYQNACMAALFGTSENTASDQAIRDMLEHLASGSPCVWEATPLSPGEHFYLLGLAPNAARISVRFFLQDTFGGFMKNLRRHYEDTEILRPAFDKFETLPLWKLLGETVNQKSRDKSPAPQLSGDVLRAILTGCPYPATLLNGVELRIRAEQEITRGRAAIIKAYYLRHGHPHCPKEVLQVEKNPESKNVPYLLGQLFSVYEQIQLAFNPDLNTTIKDKYFNSASATPATIFPLLGNLAQKHLRKLSIGQKINFDKKIGLLMGSIGQENGTFPARLDLPQQGAFQLGYYFENQERFISKKQKEDK